MFWSRPLNLIRFFGAISVLLIAVSVRAYVTASPTMRAGVHVRELKRSGNTVTIEITLPSPQFDTVWRLDADGLPGFAWLVHRNRQRPLAGIFCDLILHHNDLFLLC